MIDYKQLIKRLVDDLAISPDELEKLTHQKFRRMIARLDRAIEMTDHDRQFWAFAEKHFKTKDNLIHQAKTRIDDIKKAKATKKPESVIRYYALVDGKPVGPFGKEHAFKIARRNTTK